MMPMLAIQYLFVDLLEVNLEFTHQLKQIQLRSNFGEVWSGPACGDL